MGTPTQGAHSPLEAKCWKQDPAFVFLQVGLAVLHQTMAHFVCSQAAWLAGAEQISAVCALLRQPNPDVQLAVLSWVITREGGTCEELEKALRLTLLV